MQPGFADGYILRKRITSTGNSSRLSCWGWALRREFGPELHYGGHDFLPRKYPHDRTSDEGGLRIDLPTPYQLEPGVQHMLSMVIQPTNVSFFADTLLIGIAQLPRPVTDCFNSEEGLFLGAAGLDVGALRFYPKALSQTELQNLYENGGLVRDLSRGSQPAEADAKEEHLDTKRMSGKFEDVRFDIYDQKRAQEVGSILDSMEQLSSGSSVASYASPEAPRGEIPANTTLLVDHNRVLFALHGAWEADVDGGGEHHQPPQAVWCPRLERHGHVPLFLVPASAWVHRVGVRPFALRVPR
eukprot:CAMPEP_0180224390 /NCGR_PEP_ID=MMETSP0987-20121128/22038_1 /TAXON_ID=697907 /ORGANISM="non described non described, Strain CCMP2293" /LENGTH=298 /DNA_ID=CAMNT_0022187181 /DNA_START=33 /DNA_END=926 /DNA_ORIENTATION=-